MNIPATRMVPHYGEQIKIRASDLMAYHDDQPEEISIKCIDELIEDACELKNCVSDLKELSVSLNKTIMRMESKAGGYLKALGREDYVSPTGNIEIVKDWHVNMPKDDDDKKILFEWMKEREIFDRYATVNSKSLNALYKKALTAACKKDPEAIVLFTLPGVPESTLNERTKIKPAKGLNQEDEQDDDNQ